MWVKCEVVSTKGLLSPGPSNVYSRVDELACLEQEDEEEDVEEEVELDDEDGLLLDFPSQVPDSAEGGGEGEVDTEDKETNTECVFLPQISKRRGQVQDGRPLDGRAAIVIKRSQTFSPSAAVSKNHYICRVSRKYSPGKKKLATLCPTQRSPPGQRNKVWCSCVASPAFRSAVAKPDAAFLLAAAAGR